MKTTAEICESLKRSRVIAELLPTERRRSVPFPATIEGRPALIFVYYIDNGKPGKGFMTSAPVARVIVDKRTGFIAEVCLPPLLWHAGHDEHTVLGGSAPPGLLGVTHDQATKLFAELHALTDRVCVPQGTEAANAEVIACWQSLFTSLCVPGLMPYFTIPHRRCEYVALPGGPAVEAGRCVTRSDASQGLVMTVKTAVSPEAGSVPPKIVAADAYLLLDRLRALLRKRSQEILLREVHRISRMLGGGEMLIAVVGDCSRGKSGLVNRLLGDPLLPEGDVPTTALLTKVRCGIDRSLTFVDLDGQRHSEELSPGALASFSRDSGLVADGGVLEIGVINPWLSASGISLIDTPGVDAGQASDRAALEAVANCEGVLVTVAATSPLSLSEKNLLDEHIFRHAVPRVAFVVTKLDLIPSRERRSVLDYIKEKSAAWSEAVELWTANDVEGHEVPTGVTAGTDAVRERLTAWASDPQRSSVRASQAARQLTAVARSFESALRCERDVLRMKDDERGDVARRATTLLAGEKLLWEDLRLAFEKREIDTEVAFNEALERAMPQVHEALTRDLKKAANPRDWWLHELPHRLTSALKTLSRSLGHDLSRRVQDDQRWLATEVTAKFTVSPGPIGSASVKAPAAADELPPGSVTDLKWYQFVGRAGGVALMVGAWFVAPGGGPVVASTLATFITERIIKRKIDEQRQSLASALEEHLSKVARDVAAESRASIRKAYESMLDETRRLEGTWVRSQLQRMAHSAGAAPADSQRDLEETLAEVAAVIEQLEMMGGGLAHA